ncbi:MAG: Rieske (2Fe-2S) protein [Chloroflexi bacterium]|nr:MAG: Rieske (2Fe-2S) protein [Chloroflexota bacterium]TME99698.1 MAG: Rieske (2Fe-2S) protein [Chloroflexota bacterium]
MAIEFVTVARLSTVPPGTVIQVLAGERWYALANVDGVLHAVDNNCPHNGGPLGKGTLIGRELTCPWHGWCWDVTSGRNCWPGTDWRVSRVPVRVVGDGEIQLPVL